jgi:hypothetical protein
MVRRGPPGPLCDTIMKSSPSPFDGIRYHSTASDGPESKETISNALRPTLEVVMVLWQFQLLAISY